VPSSISAARLALFARLEVHDDLGGAEDVQVTYGAPDAHEEQKVVALLGTRDADEEAAAMGAGRKDETYELLVKVKVHDPAGTPQDVDVAGYALGDAVVDAVEGAGDYTLDNTVMWAFATSTTSANGVQAAEGGGWVIFIDVIVTCKARIDRR
jgi:hypothetical protein